MLSVGSYQVITARSLLDSVFTQKHHIPFSQSKGKIVVMQSVKQLVGGSGNGQCLVNIGDRIIIFVAVLVGCIANNSTAEEQSGHLLWKRHTIDSQSRGADGTRLADLNGDGLLDIVTGWEQGGVSRVCLHPGHELVRERWPSVTVGETPDVEDAVMFDLDSDGALDVICCCEGTQQSIFVHWSKGSDYLEANSWRTTEVTPSTRKFRWMYAVPFDMNHDGQFDIVAGGKGDQSMLGWWELPRDPRKVEDWKWHPMRKMGWLMSLEAVDMNRDGHKDLLFTDRKGEASGVYWLENPGPRTDASVTTWQQHPVGGVNEEVMFLSHGDLNGDSKPEVVVAIRPLKIAIFQTDADSRGNWSRTDLTIPSSYGTAKAPAIADFNLDGKPEIVFSTENARNPKMAIGMFVRSSPETDAWRLQPISGVDGIKHDLVVPIDLDADGDVDLITCEEVKNLGVIWYENPTLSPGQ